MPEAAKASATTITQLNSALLSPLIKLLSKFGDLGTHFRRCSIEPPLRPLVPLGVAHIPPAAIIAGTPIALTVCTRLL